MKDTRPSPQGLLGYAPPLYQLALGPQLAIVMLKE